MRHWLPLRSLCCFTWIKFKIRWVSVNKCSCCEIISKLWSLFCFNSRKNCKGIYCNSPLFLSIDLFTFHWEKVFYCSCTVKFALREVCEVKEREQNYKAAALFLNSCHNWGQIFIESESLVWNIDSVLLKLSLCAILQMYTHSPVHCQKMNTSAVFFQFAFVYVFVLQL